MGTFLMVLFGIIIGLMVLSCVFGLIGAVLGVTFGVLGAVIGVICKIVFNPVVVILVIVYLVYKLGKRSASK